MDNGWLSICIFRYSTATWLWYAKSKSKYVPSSIWKIRPGMLLVFDHHIRDSFCFILYIFFFFRFIQTMFDTNIHDMRYSHIRIRISKSCLYLWMRSVSAAITDDSQTSRFRLWWRVAILSSDDKLDIYFILGHLTYDASFVQNPACMSHLRVPTTRCRYYHATMPSCDQQINNCRLPAWW